MLERAMIVPRKSSTRVGGSFPPPWLALNAVRGGEGGREGGREGGETLEKKIVLRRR